MGNANTVNTVNNNKCYNLSSIQGFNEIIKTDDECNSTILKLTKIKHNNTLYKLIKYDKSILKLHRKTNYGLCRSLILNKDDKVVCFAPPKSIELNDFIEKYPENNVGFIRFEEFIDGTMINVFYDDTISNWEFATRNKIGADTVFYTSITFRTMFLEALNVCNLDITKLNKELCYSFVLQHPNNRIVVPVTTSQIYLVAIYKINNEPNNIYVNYLDVFDHVSFFKEIGSSVKFPIEYPSNNETTYKSLIEKYTSADVPYNVVGVVIYNKVTGDRTKIRNSTYEYVRQLRGNQSKLQYQYITLSRNGCVNDFLKYYPEFELECLKFRENINLFTKALYVNYVSCYIKKDAPLLKFSPQYRTNMFKIHQLYITTLKKHKQKVTTEVVRNYVDNMSPAILMSCLNYHLKHYTNQKEK